MLHFDLATPADDARLRQLLRENPMDGTIALSFEREPTYFQAAAVEGAFHQTLVARSGADAKIVALSSRTVRDLYVNGVAQPVGYMSMLRFDQRQAWGMSLPRTLSKGFAYYRDLHGDGRTPFYLMSIVADNAPAQRLLNAQLPQFPQLQSYAQMHTYALAVRRGKPVLSLPTGLVLRRATLGDAAAILTCLQRNHVRRQFAPVWTAETLWNSAQTPGLDPENFWVIVKGTAVIGCLARWNQRAVKQTVVRGYGRNLARWRRLINLAAGPCGWPPLPPVNSPLRHSYASHLAVDNDDPRLLAALLRAVYNDAVAQGDHYVMFGLAAGDLSGHRVTSQYRHLVYRSQLYLAHWSDGAAAVAAIDARPPGVEIAVL